LKNSISNQEFKRILFNSKSLLVRDLLFYYQKNKVGISFIVNKKKGSAVLRNLFKRRSRALYQQNNSLQNFQVIIKPVNSLKNNYSWKELKLSFDTFSSKL
jgi:ribonuclease P protein component